LSFDAKYLLSGPSQRAELTENMGTARRSTMNISEAIAKRKSIRAYMDKPMPANDLERIIEAGRWAPNAGPFQISVIRNRGLLNKINDRTLNAMVHSNNEFLQQRASLPGYQPLYGTPVLILLSGPPDAPHSARITSLAAENMLLEATALGLGSCYLVSPTLALNGEKNRDLAREAGIPDGYAVQCAVIVGYAAAQNKFSVAERTMKGSVKYVD
jgi:FMN reductase [NAD(P)H]